MNVISLLLGLLAGKETVSGLVTPLDDQSLYVRNGDGQTVVRWTSKTRVALQMNWRQWAHLKGRTLHYVVHSSGQTIDFTLPDGKVFATRETRPGKAVEEASAEKWLSARGVRIHFGESMESHRPTKGKPRFAGEFRLPGGRKEPAKLIWVTTCPVPAGFERAGSLVDGRAPRRTSGVMEKYLNPWAAEVVARHPKIEVCDQWALVKKNEGGLYTDGWKGKNVHFGGAPAVALGRILARHVMKSLGKDPGAINP